MDKEKWLLCPVCKSKTRTQIRQNTILTNFPLFCPKCKQETVINVQELHTTIIKEPDAKTQRQQYVNNPQLLALVFQYLKQLLLRQSI
jgi:ribosomal protein L44E